MLIREYRIPMPMTLEECQRGQDYSAIETSKRESGGGDGIEIVSSEPFVNTLLPGTNRVESGQYTVRKFFINNKVPTYVRVLTPKGALDLKEECWNAFPYSKSIISNEFLADRMNISVESMHLNDRGETENALNLSPDQLKMREVIMIDIGEELGPEIEAEMAVDDLPRRFLSVKTKRGPLVGPAWIQNVTPIMCCYKLVTCEFKLFGLQSRLETFIQKNEQNVFTAFHRHMFCWIDRWIDMTKEDIKKFEDRVAGELHDIRTTGALRGYRALE